MGESLRIGIIGLGNIGQTYAELIGSGQIPKLLLGAVSSRTPAPQYGVPHFTDYRDLLTAGLVDAVLIATPTMLHPEMGKQACEQGLHVLMEKPLAMSVGQARSLLQNKRSDRKFAVMLNQRFHPCYSKMKALLDSGAIGEVTRVSWTMTTWYRPDIYYEVSSWRGTWRGEGGGLSINQCIHNLDVLQWLTGLPASVSAIAGFGKYHSIDVEDEFTATLSYASGATGVVVASSGEAPGVNQFDIVGDRGMLRFDGQNLKLLRSDVSVRAHCQETNDMFGMPQFTMEDIDIQSGIENQHAHNLQNFVDSVLADEPLHTPAEEGLASLQLANGILLSAWTGESINLPLEETRYEQALRKRIKQSVLRAPSSREANIDMDDSFR